MAEANTFEQTGRQLLEELVESLAENRVREFTPQLAIFYRDYDGKMQGAVARIDNLPDDDSEIQAIMAAIGKRFQSSNRGQVESVFMVNEVWFSEAKDAEDLERVEPKDDPLRGEGIVVSGMSRDGQVSTSIIVVGRDREGVMSPRGVQTGGVIDDSDNALTAFFSGSGQAKPTDNSNDLVKEFFRRLDQDGGKLVL